MAEAPEAASWWEETRSTGFELRRHFFRRFFDSDLVSSAGQWQVLAIGFFAIVVSLSIPLTQAYYHKYRMLLELDSPVPYRMAAIADHLFPICLAMNLTGLVTAMQWASLFPGLQDYLVMAGLPVRARDIFAAKFTALNRVHWNLRRRALCAPGADPALGDGWAIPNGGASAMAWRRSFPCCCRPCSCFSYCWPCRAFCSM